MADYLSSHIALLIDKFYDYNPCIKRHTWSTAPRSEVEERTVTTPYKYDICNSRNVR